MPLPIAPNEKPAAAIIRDRLNCVLSTTRLNSGKDNRCVFLHDQGAPVHS